MHKGPKRTMIGGITAEDDTTGLKRIKFREFGALEPRGVQAVQKLANDACLKNLDFGYVLGVKLDSENGQVRSKRRLGPK